MDKRVLLALNNFTAAAAEQAAERMVNKVPFSRTSAKDVLRKATEALSAEDRQLIGASAEARQAIADLERDLNLLALQAERRRAGSPNC